MEPFNVSQKLRGEDLFSAFINEFVVEDCFLFLGKEFVHPLHPEPVDKSGRKNFPAGIFCGVHGREEPEVFIDPMEILIVHFFFRQFPCFAQGYFLFIGYFPGQLTKAFFIDFGHEPGLIVMFGDLQNTAVKEGVQPFKDLGFSKVYLVKHQPVSVPHGLCQDSFLPCEISVGIGLNASDKFGFIRHTVKVESPEAVIGKTCQISDKRCLSNGRFAHEKGRVVQKY